MPSWYVARISRVLSPRVTPIASSAFAGGHRPITVADQPKVVRHRLRELCELVLVAQPFAENLRVAQALGELGVVAEGNQRPAQLKVQIERLLQDRAGLGEPANRPERLLEIRYGFAMS